MLDVETKTMIEGALELSFSGLKRHEREMEALERRHTVIFREYRQSCENQKVRSVKKEGA